MTIHVLQLFAVNTSAKILKLGLETAQALGLPVSSWRAGDPTRSLYHYLAEVLAAHDSVVSEFIKAGFLSAAVEAAKESGSLDWLTVLAKEMYGVDVPEATYATFTVKLVNGGGGNYPRGVGEITVKASASGKTYHNTNAPAPLFGGTSVTYDFVADEPGSDSSVSAGEIDELVTTMLGVTIESNTGGYGTDTPTPDEIGNLCNATLGALSPNGPPDAYEFVCLTPKLTGSSEVTRVYSAGDSTTGLARVYVASASGAVSAAGVLACQNACEVWSTPLCVTPLVASASPLLVPLSCQLQGDNIPEGFEDLIESEYVAYLRSLPIEGTVARSAVIAAIHRAVPRATNVSLLLPAADVTPSTGQVAANGGVTAVEI